MEEDTDGAPNEESKETEMSIDQVAGGTEGGSSSQVEVTGQGATPHSAPPLTGDVTTISTPKFFTFGSGVPPNKKRKCGSPTARQEYKSVQEDNNEIMNALNSYLQGDQARYVPKHVAKEIMSYARKLEQNCIKLIMENAHLAGELYALKGNTTTASKSDGTRNQESELVSKIKNELLSEIRKEIKENLKPENKSQSFARVLSSQPRPKNTYGTVLIEHNEKAKEKFPTIESLTTGIKQNFKPSTEGIRIKNMVQTTKGVIIQTQSVEEAKKFRDSENIKNLGADVRIPNKRQPRVIIYDVPVEYTQELLSETFWRLNARELGNAGHTFKPIFKTGPKGGNSTHWVAEVSPKVWKEIMKEGRVFLEYQSCNARNWLATTRCNKCQAFGHSKDHCKARIANCAHCAAGTHETQNCPNTNLPPKCINCARTEREANHRADFKDCPSYKRELERLDARTDYGNDD